VSATKEHFTAVSGHLGNTCRQFISVLLVTVFLHSERQQLWRYFWSKTTEHLWLWSL